MDLRIKSTNFQLFVQQLRPTDVTCTHTYSPFEILSMLNTITRRFIPPKPLLWYKDVVENAWQVAALWYKNTYIRHNKAEWLNKTVGKSIYPHRPLSANISLCTVFSSICAPVVHKAAVLKRCPTPNWVLYCAVLCVCVCVCISLSICLLNVLLSSQEARQTFGRHIRH